ncbi:glycosyltransferase family 61 protein [Eilatimonas milleporae]|uniref:Uncharacterized protein DUF563 n=1 Tax=Eilatimonas milleporae TaxID=911205 RepID=A0A3M0CSD7_9PROT|nr:glycosyltransferase family 61 protein [Eilatimonas milleporae]RMB12442.1 uncharacterized protein DUF563 [Eilatimonas milleporae]
MPDAVKARMIAVPDALLHPYTDLQPPFPGGLSGVHDGDIGRHKRHGKPADCPPPQVDGPVATLPGRYMYGGPLFIHYGHFITESLGRLWGLSPADETYGPVDGVVFLPLTKLEIAGADDLRAYMTRTFEYLGLAPDRLVFPSAPVRVESLIVPEQGCGLGMPSLPAFRRFVAARRREKHSPHKYVYVSRENYLHKASLLGESLLAARLAAAGFFILRPEEYPIAEQVDILASADVLVFAEGSALHTMLLVPDYRGRVYIVRRRNNAQHFRPQLQGLGIDVREFDATVMLPQLFGQARWGHAMTDIRMVLHCLRLELGLDIDVPQRRDCIDAVEADLLRYIDLARTADGLRRDNIEPFLAAVEVTGFAMPAFRQAYARHIMPRRA